MTPQEVPAEMTPKCQYCQADPAPMANAIIQMAKVIINITYCGNPLCRAVHGIFPIGMVEDRQPGSRLIHTPGSRIS